MRRGEIPGETNRNITNLISGRPEVDALDAVCNPLLAGEDTVEVLKEGWRAAPRAQAAIHTMRSSRLPTSVTTTTHLMIGVDC